MNILCFECGNDAEHNHHVVPVSKGGKRTVPLCVDCHSKVHGMKCLNRELQQLGFAAKRERGEKWNNGRKQGQTKYKDGDVKRVKELKSTGVPILHIAKELKLSRTTVYKILSLGNAA